MLKKTDYGAEITKIKNYYATNSKNSYTGYGICFDEGGDFSKGNINNGKNVIIFGVHESSLVHAFLLWVICLCKGLTIRHCMLKNYIV